MSPPPSPGLTNNVTKKFVWPTATEFLALQENNRESCPPSLICNENDSLRRDAGRRICIPDVVDDMELHLCVIAHTGPSGNRGNRSSLRTFRSHLTGPTDLDDMSTFVKSGVHCLSAVGGGKELRLLGPAFHGTKPNNLLQFNHIKVFPGASSEKYALMLCNVYSDYEWFFAYASADFENSALPIID